MMEYDDSQTYQDQGNELDINDANRNIAAARKATPQQYRSLYHSVIRWMGKSYYWGWILR